MEEGLLKWLEIFDRDVDVNKLSDGIFFSTVLHEISPQIFSESRFLSKIKQSESVGSNWRLKVSNLKKILDGIWEFYDDINASLPEQLLPDVNQIAEHKNAKEIGKLIQLILGCAVNCAEKQKYITQITELEESVQSNIMKAIQEIEYIWLNSRNSMSGSISSTDLKLVQEERDDLAQKCHEKDRQISNLLEEKANIQQELQKLKNQMKKLENPGIGDDLISLGPVHEGSSRYNEMRKRVDQLNGELLNSEAIREELNNKCSLQDNELMILQAKVKELNKALAEQSQLKDEIDVLREESDKAKRFENQLLIMKKRLEDCNDLKKQMKLLEERNAEYLKQNSTLTEEAKKYSGLKGQSELYKKELQELHSKLDAEMNKTVKIQFDYNILQTKISGLERERDNFRQERDSLRETIDELQCSQGATSDADSSANISREILGENLREKVDLLEAENKALREGEGGKTALSQLLDDANQRNEKLREQLKSANQKILALSQNDQNKSDMQVQLKQAVELNEQKGSLLEQAQMQINSLSGRVKQLETTLQTKEQEYSSLDAKYKKCVEKAKEVIRAMDPRASNDAALLEKPQDPNADSSMSRTEEKLMATAFYNLGLACQREAVDARLALLSGQGQSFLARQRQPPARKPLNFKK